MFPKFTNVNKLSCSKIMLALLALCAACASGSGKPSSEQSDPKKKGFFTGFLFRSKKSKWIAGVATVFLILSIMAIGFDAGSCFNNVDLGANVFQDEGASRYLRLAIIIPTITFIVGALVVNYVKYKHLPTSEDKLQEYNEECGQEWYTFLSAKKMIGDNTLCTTYFGIFSFMMIALGMAFMATGMSGNFDDPMFWCVIGSLCGFGIIGVVGAAFNGLGQKKLSMCQVNWYLEKVSFKPKLMSQTSDGLAFSAQVQEWSLSESYDDLKSAETSIRDPLSDILNAADGKSSPTPAEL